MGAEQLQVVDVVTAVGAGNDVVNIHYTEGELAATTVAATFLLPEVVHVTTMMIAERVAEFIKTGD